MLNLFKRRKTYIEISPSIVVFTAGFLMFSYFLYLIRHILILLFMSFILMVALNPAVNKLEKRIHSRLLSIVIVYILVIVVISSTLAFLVPPLAQQLIQLLRLIDLPYLQNVISELKFTAQELNQFADNYGESINALLSVVTSTFRSLFTFLTLFVISFYLIADEPKLHLKIGWLTSSKKHYKIARKFLDDIEEQLGGWVRGQLILMIVIGIVNYAGLALMGIPYALPLALLSALLEILPNLGPTLSAVPAVIIAFLDKGNAWALATVGFYIIVQQLENNFLVPRVMKKNADVNPLIAILSILIGFQLYGVIGGLLAIPIYIMARTIYSYWRKYKQSLTPDW